MTPNTGTGPFRISALINGVESLPPPGWEWLAYQLGMSGVCPETGLVFNSGFSANANAMGYFTDSQPLPENACRGYRLELVHLATGEVIPTEVAHASNL